METDGSVHQTYQVLSNNGNDFKFQMSSGGGKKLPHVAFTGQGSQQRPLHTKISESHLVWN